MVSAMQVPMRQVWPMLHMVPHIPQFVLLVCVSTQLSPQRVWPISHIGAGMSLEGISSGVGVSLGVGLSVGG